MNLPSIEKEKNSVLLYKNVFFRGAVSRDELVKDVNCLFGK